MKNQLSFRAATSAQSGRLTNAPAKVRGGEAEKVPAGRFTLIELLVVVAIIAVLAALLMPALRHARGTAVTTACLSQCRQMHVAITQYQNDFNMAEPFRFANGTSDYPGEAGHRLSERLVKMDSGAPYLEDPEMLFCPGWPGSWQVYWHPDGASGGGINSTYQYCYRHIQRELDPAVDNTGHHPDGQTDLRLSKHDIPPESYDVLLIDGWGEWTPGAMPYNYEHYNVIFAGGNAKTLGTDRAVYASFLWNK